jgi:hypothetical protein
MEMRVCWWAIGVGFGTVDFLFLVGNSTRVKWYRIFTSFVMLFINVSVMEYTTVYHIEILGFSFIDFDALSTST